VQDSDEPNFTPERKAQALSVLEAASGADPRDCTLGFFSSDDFQWGIGGFLWFPSDERLFECLAGDLLMLDDADPTPVARRVRHALSRFTGERRRSKECFDELRAALKGSQDLAWIGTFDELCTSPGDWPVKVRTAFRELADDLDPFGDPSGQIERSDVPEFIAFLRDYGH